MQLRLIREFSWPAAAFKLQEAFDEGYRLSEDVKYYPCFHGYSYEVTVVKQEDTNLVDFSSIPTETTKQPRKTKGQ